jgi:branched-chain amino acid transport system permease protein
MKRKFIVPAALCFLAISLPMFVANRLVLTVLIMCYYYAYLALCWNLVGGYSGQLSLGHGIFYGVGAYTSVALSVHLGMSPWFGMIIGAILASICAFALGNLTFGFELKGFFFIVVMLSITQIFQEIAKQIPFLGESEGISLPVRMGWRYFQFGSKAEYYYIILFLMLVAVLISILIERSKMGYNLVAIREDEDTAEASGVDSKRGKTVILTLSAFLTALGGSFFSQFTYFVDPETAFSTALNINLILAVVIGGIGTVAGPIVGAFVFVLISELLRFVPMRMQVVAALTRVIFALVLMYIMIYCPRGILHLRWFDHLQKVISRGERKAQSS